MGSLELTPLRRGLLEKLIKRGRPVKIQIIGAILGWKIPKGSEEEEFPVSGEGKAKWKLILPNTLFAHLFCNSRMTIKQEP